jgi:hypothetical protein
MKWILIGVSLLAASFSVLAEIPNTFTANTSAKAADVNANFDYLDNKLIVAEQKLTEAITVAEQKLTEAIADKCFDNHIDYPYFYSKKEAALGTVLKVGEVEYRLVKISVTDPKTKDVFHITYPVTSKKRSNGTSFVSFRPFLYADYDEPICNNTTISNQPSRVIKNIGFVIESDNQYSNYGEIHATDSSFDNQSSSSMKASIRIAVGTLSFLMGFEVSGNSGKSIVTPDDYDFTDDKVTLSDFDFSESIQEISILLDHIIIEKITR